MNRPPVGTVLRNRHVGWLAVVEDHRRGRAIIGVRWQTGPKAGTSECVDAQNFAVAS